MRESLVHTVYNDRQLRIRQVIGLEHIGIAIESGDLTPGFESFQAVMIRDDYE